MAKKLFETEENAETPERIRNLQRKLEELAGSNLSFFESAEMSQELREQFWERVVAYEENEDSAWHIDLVSSGSEEDSELYLRYYADEETRQRWAKDWPDDAMPAHETPPYDRDRHLPARDQPEWRRHGRPS